LAGALLEQARESALLASPRYGRLISEDSWMAVATAITQPRGGTPMPAPTLMMVAALPTAWLSHAPTAG